MPATLAASFSAWRYEAKWPEAGAQARAAAQGVRQVGPRVSDTETAFPLNQSRGMRAAASNLLRRVPTRCCPRCGDPAARPPGRLPPASPRHAALGQVCAVGVCVARTCKCCLVRKLSSRVHAVARARGGGTGAPALSALPLALPTVEASGSWDCVAGQSTRATSPGASAHRRAPHASPCRHLPARAVGRGTGPPSMQRVGWGAYVCGSAPGRGRGHVDVHEVGQARLLVIAPLAAGQRSVVQKLHTHRRPAPSQSSHSCARRKGRRASATRASAGSSVSPSVLGGLASA